MKEIEKLSRIAIIHYPMDNLFYFDDGLEKRCIFSGQDLTGLLNEKKGKKLGNNEDIVGIVRTPYQDFV